MIIDLLHPADWVILLVLVLFMALGLFKGFVREAIALVGLLAAFILARVFAHPLDQWLTEHIETPSIRLALAYGSLFFGTLLLAQLLGHLLKSFISMAGLSVTDRLLGMILGLIKGAVIVLALLMLLAPFVSKDQWWHQAVLPESFMRYEPLGRMLKDELFDVALPADSEDSK